jgi:hypothetical protein
MQTQNTAKHSPPHATPHNPPIQRTGEPPVAMSRTARDGKTGSHSAAVHSTNTAPIQSTSTGQTTQQGARVQSGGQNVQNDTRSSMTVQHSQHKSQQPSTPVQKQSSPIPITTGNIGAQPPASSTQPIPVTTQQSKTQTPVKTEIPVKPEDKPATGKQPIKNAGQTPKPIDLKGGAPYG